MSSNAMEILKFLSMQNGTIRYCEGCSNTGYLGEKCQCGSYIMNEKPLFEVNSNKLNVVTTVKRCAFCDNENITDLKPVCGDCEKIYKLSLISNFPGCVNGWNYLVDDVKYYINPYIGRYSTNISYGTWREVVDNGNKFLEHVKNPPLPNKK